MGFLTRLREDEQPECIVHIHEDCELISNTVKIQMRKVGYCIV